MTKPRGTIVRSTTPKKMYPSIETKEVEIAAWCPDDEAKLPPEQVHLIVRLQDLDASIVVRFKSPDILGFLIEELARYRREVWPGSEKEDLENNLLRAALEKYADPDNWILRREGPDEWFPPTKFSAPNGPDIARKALKKVKNGDTE